MEYGRANAVAARYSTCSESRCRGSSSNPDDDEYSIRPPSASRAVASMEYGIHHFLGARSFIRNYGCARHSGIAHCPDGARPDDDLYGNDCSCRS